MAKCFRCGKKIALRPVQLKDEMICMKCAKNLGMDKTEILVASQYTYDDIKDGMAGYYAKQILKRSILQDIENRKIGLNVANYGQERELICTEEERQIFDLISDHFPADDLRLVRVSDDYVTIKRNEWDIARIKYTNRAKWIILPCIEVGSVKHKIQSVDDCAAYFDQIRESIEIARKSEV